MKKGSTANIYKVLAARTSDTSLTSDIDRIVNRAEPILAKITETFSDYTIHDIRHSKKIIEILSWVIPPKLIGELNDYELYFLIASCYLHDIGMADIEELDTDELRSIVNIEEKREFIRKAHHLRSETFVINNYEKLGIEDEHQARIIGRICRGHRERQVGELYSHKEMYTSKNIAVNIPLLAALLQLADDLDLTFERTPKIIYDLLKPKNEISKEEWERHLRTCGVGQDPENALRIVITAKCWNLKVHRALKGLESKIQDQLDALSDRLFQYSDFSSELPQRVIVNIENIGYEVIDLKFKLQEKEITAILMGEQLYDRPEAAIRELLQNSYDACRHRRVIEPKLVPKISFELTADKQKLVIIDNGVGMTKERIEKYLVRIGSCFYKSKEFIEMNLDFTPISNFGIGFLSCFMIADHIQIETRAKDDQSYSVEMYGIEDYFLMKKGVIQENGTKITLFLKEEVRKSLDLEKELRYYARHLEFPVSIILPDGEKKEIINENIVPITGWFLSNYQENTDNYTFKSSEIKTDKFTVKFDLLAMEEKRVGLIPAKTNWWDREFKKSKL